MNIAIAIANKAASQEHQKTALVELKEVEDQSAVRQGTVESGRQQGAISNQTMGSEIRKKKPGITRFQRLMMDGFVQEKHLTMDHERIGFQLLGVEYYPACDPDLFFGQKNTAYDIVICLFRKPWDYNRVWNMCTVIS